MTTKLLLVVTCGLVAGSAAWAADAPKPTPKITVTFVSPEKFTDVKEDSWGADRDRDYLLDKIKTHIEARARGYLTAGQYLEIKVTDIDLAGDFEPWHGAGFDNIRILKDVYPPRMELEFRLLGADGRVLSEGKRHLSDIGYLLTSPLPTSDGLRYDKEMISDWMRTEFRQHS